MPGTLKRSSKEAQDAFAQARDSAVGTHGEGDEAQRAAYATLKEKFEKRGDHWIAKDPDPSDPGDEHR
ncbi:MAG: ChaB family protein [Actinomycetota bacterium]|nr:ChaB family protein [Actinomycetota bacterium]